MNKKKIEGLGDVVKKVTNALGIETCDACEERRKKLNSMFPFTKQAKELNENDIAFLKRIRFASTIGSEDINFLFELNNKVFDRRTKPCHCSGLIIEMRDKLWNVYLANHSKNIDEN